METLEKFIKRHRSGQERTGTAEYRIQNSEGILEIPSTIVPRAPKTRAQRAPERSQHLGITDASR